MDIELLMKKFRAKRSRLLLKRKLTRMIRNIILSICAGGMVLAVILNVLGV